jgi:drug/metabolite transporter (DMT)-like permease
VGTYTYLLTTMAFFGSAFASSKVAVESMPHQVAALLRFGGGAVILALFLALSRLRSRGEPLTRQQVLRAAGVGLIGVFGYNVLFFWGLSLAPSADGSIIVPALSPVFTTTIILLAFRQEEPSTRRLVGLSAGLAGAVIFFIGASGSGGGGRRLEGDVIYLLGAVAWALYSVASKKVLKGVDPLHATTYGTTIGAIGLLLFAAPVLPSVHWTSVSTTAWLNVVYLAIGPTAIAYLFYFRGLRNVSPSTATMAMFTVPVSGVACSFTAAQLVGGVVMLAGALVAVASGRGRQAAQARRARRPARHHPGLPEAASALRLAVLVLAPQST